MDEDDILCYRARDDSSMNEQNVRARLKTQRKNGWAQLLYRNLQSYNNPRCLIAANIQQIAFLFLWINTVFQCFALFTLDYNFLQP